VLDKFEAQPAHHPAVGASIERRRRTSVMSDGGPIAPDGSPVEFYRLAPEEGEATIIHDAVPAGCDILELGSGPGRITHRLIELGHRVVAVDDSPNMLRYIRGADTVLSDIESLNLGRTFPGVVLASYLVNTPDRSQRRAFLDACARHVSPTGSVLIQRAHPELDWAGQEGYESVRDRLRIRTQILKWHGHRFHAVAEYTIGDRTWKQEYVSELLDDEALQGALADSGLEVKRWLDGDREWLEATTRRGDSSVSPSRSS
jgi:SAM-dependent methyltransferase